MSGHAERPELFRTCIELIPQIAELSGTFFETLLKLFHMHKWKYIDMSRNFSCETQKPIDSGGNGLKYSATSSLESQGKNRPQTEIDIY